MLKRLFSIGLVVLLFHAGNSVLMLDVARANQRDAAAEKVKASVAKRCCNDPKAKVTVKLKDKTKLKGYVRDAGYDSFNLLDSKSGQVRTLVYSDVAEVKHQGGLSLPAKIGIGVGIGVGALALLYAIGCAGDNGGYAC